MKNEIYVVYIFIRLKFFYWRYKALTIHCLFVMQVMRGEKLVHLVPSLDGDLYQFDGDAIEPVPLGADLLLSSSFRFTDELTVVGGKEVETYGIDLKTGKVCLISLPQCF